MKNSSLNSFQVRKIFQAEFGLVKYDLVSKNEFLSFKDKLFTMLDRITGLLTKIDEEVKVIRPKVSEHSEIFDSHDQKIKKLKSEILS